MRRLILELDEIRKLSAQDPNTARDGGFQHFLVRLQGKINHSTQEIRLDDKDLEDIPRYAFDFKNGGWQHRLLSIFRRTLGDTLGR